MHQKKPCIGTRATQELVGNTCAQHRLRLLSKREMRLIRNRLGNDPCRESACVASAIHHPNPWAAPTATEGCLATQRARHHAADARGMPTLNGLRRTPTPNGTRPCDDLGRSMLGGYTSSRIRDPKGAHGGGGGGGPPRQLGEADGLIA